MTTTTGIVTEQQGRRVVICAAPQDLAIGEVVSVAINVPAASEEAEGAIVALLKTRPMGRSEITRALRRFRAAALSEAIDRLEADGKAVVTGCMTRGRPATVIRLASQPEAV